MGALCATASTGDTLRVATYHTELSRKGPGLFLRDLGRGGDDIDHVLAAMARVSADIWVLQGIDYDAGGHALRAFAKQAGFAHHLALTPNSGQRTGVDIDGDGRIGTAQDAQSFGWFSGKSGMAILSRHPVSPIADDSALLWAKQPWATLPMENGAPTLSKEAQAVLRLSYVGHWTLEVDVNGLPLRLLTSHHTTPVFDDPEDRNGLRNADELRLMTEMIARVAKPDLPPFVVAANFNLDPEAGEGRRAVIAEFLEDPRLIDPLPGTPTVDFGSESAGKLRVSYVLPAVGLNVVAAGVGWSETPSAPNADIRFTRHHPVWVDLAWPP